MSLSEDEDELPVPKKQRIYFGSLEEKMKESLYSAQKASPDDVSPREVDGDDENDDVSDPIAEAIKAGNINIADGIINFICLL